MSPISKSGSLLESCSVSFCHDTWKAGSEVSHVVSVGLGLVASSDCVSTTSGEGDNVSVGAKDDDSYYNCGLNSAYLHPG